MPSTFELFEQGKLFDATQSAIQGVKESPGEIEKRWELVTMLCFEGDLDRAEKHIKVMMEQAADVAADLMVLHSLLKGEIARRQCFEEGRLPNFTDQPSQQMQDYLCALTELKNDPPKCAEVLAKIHGEQQPRKGICDDRSFEGFQDINAMTGLFFEAITMAGDYYWLPFETIKAAEFGELSAPQDIIWRQAELTTIDHETVTAYLPQLYHGTHNSEDELLRLGRAADFSAELPVMGLGGRTFKVGNDNVPMSMIRQLSFEN